MHLDFRKRDTSGAMLPDRASSDHNWGWAEKLATCEKPMQKIRAALIPDGQCVTLDFVPQEDRVSPPTAAAFALVTLRPTPAGEAYTFTEYDTMFSECWVYCPRASSTDESAAVCHYEQERTSM